MLESVWDLMEIVQISERNCPANLHAARFFPSTLFNSYQLFSSVRSKSRAEEADLLFKLFTEFPLLVPGRLTAVPSTMKLVLSTS
jgi:hypothetical protein